MSGRALGSPFLFYRVILFLNNLILLVHLPTPYHSGIDGFCIQKSSSRLVRNSTRRAAHFASVQTVSSFSISQIILLYIVINSGFAHSQFLCNIFQAHAADNKFPYFFDINCYPVSSTLLSIAEIELNSFRFFSAYSEVSLSFVTYMTVRQSIRNGKCLILFPCLFSLNSLYLIF